ncbi:Pro-kumamolisin, activation domain-containing protein [Fomitopsis serialis]|uniref:Pro-kumamolisin, activation domain-containing protein n=1 Tax=Fomitopsis serialis TaxID=139415 RepID=UPI00200777DE|nr:Pro-kumamolisin, activation domain-containing protein [Neoantrodia serialis]KAH9922264.1 Pro-kumamolisin, activation domain-containing protein [Neoantrodia serialis]
MPSLRSALLWAILGALAAAAPAEYTHRVKETVHPPRGWNALRPAPPAHTIELRIGLPQPKFAELEEHLYAVSDPSSERYGEHLSKEDVEALVAPHPESVQLVEDWLASHGLLSDALSRSPAGDWVTVRVPVSLAEIMLDTTYHVWTHAASGDSLVRTTSYSLPEHLHDHIEVVQPTTMFSRFTPMRTTYRSFRANTAIPQSDGATIAVPSASGGQVAASCNGTITPECLLELYNATGYTPQVPGENKIAVTGYLEQYANYADYYQFLGEEWLGYVLSAEDLPQSISTSYGDDEQTVPTAMRHASARSSRSLVCARGVSIMFSSGDGGVGDGDPDPATQECYSNDGRNVTMFIPEFPASCPYDSEVPEIAAWFSGGGFSNYVRWSFAATDLRGALNRLFSSPRPSYQDTAVTKYLGELAPGTYAGLYNASGRAYPDVSAEGVNFTMYGMRKLASSTGLLPTWLPQPIDLFAQRTDDNGFNDITVGNNPGCGTEGFNTTIGWDPVTGWGTPNFGVLKELVLGA